MLDAALKRSAGEKGGRPPFDAVLMVKMVVLQAMDNLADEQTEYQILDRLSFKKCRGLAEPNTVPDARTIWLFREHLIAAQAGEKLFAQFDAMLDGHGFQASASAGSKRFSPEGKKEKREGREGGQRKTARPMTAIKTTPMWIENTN